MTGGLFLGLATLGFTMISVVVAATWKLSRDIGKAYGHAENQVEKHEERCRNYIPGPKPLPAAVPTEVSDR